MQERRNEAPHGAAGLRSVVLPVPPAAAGASSRCQCQPNPIVTEQRTEDSCLFPAAVLCHPRAAGAVTAGSWWHLAAPDGSVRASCSRVTETLREGRKTHPATRRQALCLISSPHLQCSEEDSIFWARGGGCGRSAGSVPMPRAVPAARACPPTARGDPSGVAQGHARHPELWPLTQQDREAAALRPVAAPARVPWALAKRWRSVF